MSRRFALSLAVIAAVLLALTISNIRYSPWTNTSARTIDQRGPLSEGERANIELFERVSPSVVQVAALKAREQRMPFYQVMEELGYYSREKYLRQNPEQQTWTIAEQYEFMRSEGVKATWQDPLAAANIYLHGLMISIFDPGASEYLRLFRLYPKSGRILNGVVSEGILATAINLVTTHPLLSALTCVFGVLLLLYYVLSLIGLKSSIAQLGLPLWLLLTTGLYLIALSGGTIAASRFRLPVMIVVCILAGQGLSIALSRMQAWKDQLVSGLQLGEANLTRNP